MLARSGKGVIFLEKSFTPEVIEAITKIIKNGNSAEIKKEQGRIVVVEIKRQVKTKTVIKG